jgi:hypothetical protein
MKERNDTPLQTAGSRYFVCSEGETLDTVDLNRRCTSRCIEPYIFGSPYSYATGRWIGFASFPVGRTIPVSPCVKYIACFYLLFHIWYSFFGGKHLLTAKQWHSRNPLQIGSRLQNAAGENIIFVVVILVLICPTKCWARNGRLDIVTQQGYFPETSTHLLEPVTHMYLTIRL